MACLRCTALVLILGIGLSSNGTAAELALQLESQDRQVQLKVYADGPDAAGQTKVSVIVNAKQPGNRAPLNELTEGVISLAFPEEADVLYDKVQVMVWGYSEQDYITYERDPGWTKGIPALGNYLLGLIPGYSLVAGVDDVAKAFLPEHDLVSPPAAFVDPNTYDVVPLSWKGKTFAPGYRSVKLSYTVRMNDQGLSSVALYGYVKAQERGESGPTFTSEHVFRAEALSQLPPRTPTPQRQEKAHKHAQPRTTSRPVQPVTSAECIRNLEHLRSAIQRYRIDNGTNPAQLDPRWGISLKCPISDEPYRYDRQTGQVRCITPGHEEY